MKMLLGVVAIGALSFAGHAVAADAAATLGGIDGAVSVAHDGQLSSASAGALAQGDRVIVADGAARVTFADGCVVDMSAQSMVTVGAASPCATGEGLIRATDGETAQTWSDMNAIELTGAVLTIGLLTYGVIEILDDDDDGPVSP
jgi:hypothetical protein